MAIYRRLLLVLAGIFTFVIVALTVYALVYNGKLISGFDDSESIYDYEAVLKKDRVEHRDIIGIFPSASAPIKIDYVNDIVAPDSIKYYQNLGDTTPYYVIDKGDGISVRVGEDGSKAYGLHSLPTTERGWRLAMPFEVKNADVVDKLLYVKLSDLRKVCNDLFEQNPRMIRTTKSAAVRQLLMRGDYSLYRGFYRAGIFLSPDLLMPVFSLPSFILLLLAVSSLCVRALLTRKISG